MTDQHTEEPWYLTPIGSTIRGKRYHTCASGRQYVFSNADVAKLPVSPNRRGDGRRIVAAVNGCKGIPTEALETGVVADMLKALRYADAEFERLGLPADCGPRLNIRTAIAKAESKA